MRLWLVLLITCSLLGCNEDPEFTRTDLGGGDTAAGDTDIDPADVTEDTSATEDSSASDVPEEDTGGEPDSTASDVPEGDTHEADVPAGDTDAVDTADVTEDTAADSASDVAPDSDVMGDTTSDTTPDTTGDAVGDTVADTVGDTVADTTSDTTQDTDTGTGARPNLAFVSSRVYPGGLGGRAAYDAECQALADTAKHPGTFIAYLATSSSPAVDRLSGSAGWVRVDGRPIVNEPAALTAAAFFYPLNLDENGGVVTAPAWTGSLMDGQPDADRTCGDWTIGDTSAQGALGSSARPFWWQGFGASVACSVSRRLYCFEVGNVADVTPTAPASARLAFVTTSTNAGAGRAAYDALCAEQGPAGRTFLAAVATSTEPAMSRFDLTGPAWARPDGALLAETAQGLADGQLLTAFAVEADGDFRNTTALTGSTDPESNATDNCRDWSTTNRNTTGVTGNTNSLDGGWFNFSPRGCNSGGIIYCLEP